MSVFHENILLKEKLDEVEIFHNSNSNNVNTTSSSNGNSTDINCREVLKDNLIFLKNLSSIIEKSMKDRKYFEEKLEKMGLILISPPHDKDENSTILKIEYN